MTDLIAERKLLLARETEIVEALKVLDADRVRLIKELEEVLRKLAILEERLPY